MTVHIQLFWLDGDDGEPQDWIYMLCGRQCLIGENDELLPKGSDCIGAYGLVTPFQAFQVTCPECKDRAILTSVDLGKREGVR